MLFCVQCVGRNEINIFSRFVGTEGKWSVMLLSRSLLQHHLTFKIKMKVVISNIRFTCRMIIKTIAQSVIQRSDILIIRIKYKKLLTVSQKIILTCRPVLRRKFSFASITMNFVFCDR